MNSQSRAKSTSAPVPNEIQGALARVLASRAFASAERAKEFLRFVVEETLAGRGGRLKGYAIAVEVFGRSADFDSASDPLVRVEAGRLRRRLTEYYLNEGHADAIRIELPRGGYQPRFRHAPAVIAEGKESRFTSALRNPLVLGVAIGTVAVLVAMVSIWTFSSFSPGSAEQTTQAPATAESRGPRLVVLPLANRSEHPHFDMLAAALTEEIILALVDFDVVAMASPTGEPLESAELSALREQFDARYVFTGSVRPEPGSVRIALRLIDARVGTQLWTRVFEERSEAIAALQVQEHIARTVAMLLASPFGPVFEHEIASTMRLAVEKLDPYQCLLRFYGYARSLDPADHEPSVRCMERAVRFAPDLAAAWSSLAVLYLHEHTFGYNPQPARGSALERALEAARTALDIDGSDRVAALTMAGVRRAAGDLEGFKRAAGRALALRPSHPAVRAQIGYQLTLAGNWEHGFPLVEEAAAVTVNVPGWYYVSHAFRYLQSGDYPEALEWALRIDAPNWFVTPLTVAATAALADRPDLASREVSRLLELRPDFATTGRAQLGKWQLDEALLETLIQGLRTAGLPMQ